MDKHSISYFIVSTIVLDLGALILCCNAVVRHDGEIFLFVYSVAQSGQEQQSMDLRIIDLRKEKQTFSFGGQWRRRRVIVWKKGMNSLYSVLETTQGLAYSWRYRDHSLLLSHSIHQVCHSMADFAYYFEPISLSIFSSHTNVR